MSQSTGWADNIILAMAPLGVMTVIISAIRVGGPSWLKAIIGRARENRAVAESELMSSTSNEVCELWNGQAIVRVMGDGPIREFIILSPEKHGGAKGRAGAGWSEFELKNAATSRSGGSDSVNGQMDMDAKTLVMELDKAKTQNHMADYSQYATSFSWPNLTLLPDPTIRERIAGSLRWKTRVRSCPEIIDGKKTSKSHQRHSASHEKPTFRDRILRRRIVQGRDPEDAPAEPNTREVSSESNVEDPSRETPSVIVVRNTSVHTPNLFLNIHNHIGKGELYAVAAFAILLQLGVLVYFGVAAKYLNHVLLKDGDPVADYAFPCTAVGTLLLVTGTLICAHVVESSTSEKRYRPADGMTARVVWLQRSGTVNDQSFDSFAVFPDDPQDLIITSQRAPRRKIKDIWRSNIVSREMTSGQQQRRGLWGRLLRAEVEETMAVTGTSLGTCGFIVQFIGLRAMHWSVSVTQLGAIIIMTVLRAAVRRNIARNPRSQPLLSGHEMDWLAMTLGDRGNAPWQDPQKHAGKWDRCDRPWTEGNGWDWNVAAVESPADESHPVVKDGSQPSRARRIMGIRRDIGELAGWPGPASAEAISLARAIEVTMDAIFHDPKPISGNLTWSLRNVRPGFSSESIPFHVKWKDGKWKAYSDEVEAALSLWLYSVNERGYSRQSVEDKSSDYSTGTTEANELVISNQRVQEGISKKSSGTTTDREEGVKEGLKDDAWLRATGTQERPSLRLLGPYTASLLRDLEWWMPNGASMIIEVDDSDSNHADNSDSEDTNSNLLEVEPHHVVGFAPGSLAKSSACLYERKARQRPREGGAFAVKSYSSLKTLYAQHMFSVFMWTVAKTMGSIPRKANVRPIVTDRWNDRLAWQSITLHDSRLSRMAQDIQNTGLGSSEDIFLSIIPPLSAEKKLPRIDGVVEWAREQAKPHERKGHWEDAAGAYLWLLRKATALPRRDDVAEKATALFVECLRVVTDAISDRKARKFETRDIKPLSDLKDQLEKELQNADVDDILSTLAGVYDFQCRPWDTPLVQTPKEVEGDDPMFKLANVNRKAPTEVGSKNRIWQGRDILGWTAIHYVAAKSRLGFLKKLLPYRPDLNARDARGRSPLHYASQHGYSSIAQELVREGAEIDMRDTDGRTPLHNAIIHGHSDLARLLIDSGADINMVDVLGSAALHHAAFHGRDTLIKVLDGANAKLRDQNGRTVLHLAALAEEGTSMHLAFVKHLIETGKVDRDVRDKSGQTPLHQAVRNKGEVAKYLLEEAKADGGAKDNRKRTPLHYAVANDKPDIAKFLIETGGFNKEEKDEELNTPLHLAARCSLDAVKYLIEEARVETEPRNNHDRTPLYEAVIGGREDIAKYLIKEGKADKDATDGGRTLLEHAITTGRKGMVMCLIKEGVDQATRSSLGETPLHRASQWGYEDISKILIKSGANMEAKDTRGRTPLHTSVELSRLQNVRCLVKAGANKEARDMDGRTPLHYSARRSNDDTAKCLIELGANKEARDNEGQTPLHIAAKSGELQNVQYLVSIGADKDARDKEGRTPVDVASRHHHTRAIRKLLSPGP